MESTAPDLFSLHIDPVTKTYLHETSRWGKFLAIVGFVMCALTVLIGLLFATVLSSYMGAAGAAGVAEGFFGVGMAVVYLIFAIIGFFPCLFLYRFSMRMRQALNGNSQEDLNDSLQNLKSLFKFAGVVTLIFLAIYALIIAFALIAGLATR